jgi:hypothetical protein
MSSAPGQSQKVYEYYSLATIQRKLGHDNVDVLKMDIERHEFPVIASLTQRLAPRQILFEVHVMNAYSMWGRPITEAQWEAMWTSLSALGYGVFNHQPSPRMCECCKEYSLIRRP